jgi:cystathionine beta-lyase/cystathionine gamma-synthase
MSHVEMSRSERAAMGISEVPIRHLVGVEDTEDLTADLVQALAACRRT